MPYTTDMIGSSMDTLCVADKLDKLKLMEKVNEHPPKQLKNQNNSPLKHFNKVFMGH